MKIEIPDKIAKLNAIERVSAILSSNWVLTPAPTESELEGSILGFEVERTNEYSSYKFTSIQNKYHMKVWELEDAVHRLHAVGAVGDEETDVQSVTVRVASEDLMPRPPKPMIRLEQARARVIVFAALGFTVGALLMLIIVLSLT